MARSVFISWVCFLNALIAATRSAQADAPPASFTIRADWFDRGNVRASVRGTEYADKHPCIWNAGQLRDRPESARSASRLAYRPYQPVYNVGFRVVAEAK